MISQICIICLAVIAGIVSYRQYRHGDRQAGFTWALIVGYWIVLTLKNIADLIF